MILPSKNIEQPGTYCVAVLPSTLDLTMALPATSYNLTWPWRPNMDDSWAPKIHFYISIHPHEVHFVQIKWSFENSSTPIHHQFFLVNLSQYIFIFRFFPNCCVVSPTLW
jgi:hypothetical protein